jgi:hypothetical protein
VEKIDVAALLAKNPQVDQDTLRVNEGRIAEARKLAGKKTEQPVVAPYGGRRLVRDDDGRIGTARQVAPGGRRT